MIRSLTMLNQSGDTTLGRTMARVAAVRDADPVIVIKDQYVERTKSRWARELWRFAGTERLEIAA